MSDDPPPLPRDLTLVLATENTDQTTAWTVVGSGSSRAVAGFELGSGAQHARVAVEGASGRLSLQGVKDRILVSDSNTSRHRSRRQRSTTSSGFSTRGVARS